MIVNKIFFVLILLIIPNIIYAQESNDTIPRWFDFVYVAWQNGEISDIEVLNAIKYLVETNIIQIHDAGYMSDEEHKAELAAQEIKHKIEKRNLTEQHGVISSEYDQEIIDIKERHDGKIEEWKQMWKDSQEKIKELENKIKELENQ